MKKYPLLSLSIAAALCLAAPAAYALDFGAAVTAGNDIKKTAPKKRHSNDPDWMMGYPFGFNLVANQEFGKDKRFNYRAALGYQYIFGGHGGFISRTGMHRVLWTNTIGIGLIQKEKYRFWLGPQLGMSVDFTAPNPGRRHNRGTMPVPFKHDGSHVTLNGYAGVATVLDMNVAKNVFMNFELGFRAGYGGSVNGPKISMVRLEPFASVGFLYRFGQTGGEKSKL